MSDQCRPESLGACPVSVHILTWFVKGSSPQEQDKKLGYSKNRNSITPEVEALTPPQVTQPCEGPAHAQDTPGSFAATENEGCIEKCNGISTLAIRRPLDRLLPTGIPYTCKKTPWYRND